MTLEAACHDKMSRDAETLSLCTRSEGKEILPNLAEPGKGEGKGKKSNPSVLAILKRSTVGGG